MKYTRVLLLTVFSLIGMGCTHINTPPPGEGVKDPPSTATGGDLTGQVVDEDPNSPRVAEILEKVTLPDGFSIEVYAEVPNARSLAFAYDQERNANIVFVGNKDEGSVYALIDRGADNNVDETREIVSNRNSPNGVAYADGDLYVAEIDTVHLFPNILDALYGTADIESTVFYDSLPDDESHGWKYLAFGPEGDLYLQVGAPCNICEREMPYSTIMRIDLDSKQATTVARGIRQSVGFARDPESGDMWFTDNGRDNLGDDLPPDELNRITTEGEHFGYPYCYGMGVEDLEKGSHDCSTFTPPHVELGPHHAALGLKFYDGDMFPEEYQGKIFIAEHGSRNSSIPVGYRIAIVDPVTRTYEPFVQGRQADAKTWGRPVDILILPDGSMLVSDDYAGIVYRVTYTGEEAGVDDGSAAGGAAGILPEGAPQPENPDPAY